MKLQWLDADHTRLRADLDNGETIFVPAVRVSDLLLRLTPEGGEPPTVDEYAPPAATTGDIIAEAMRRLNNTVPQWRVLLLSARMFELLTVRTTRAWTTGEQAEVASLRNTWQAIGNLKDKVETLIAFLPADYKDDKYWQ